MPTDTAPNTLTKRYSDSPAGVRAMLAANFDASLAIAHFEPDPYCLGVWRVHHESGACAIVFLAGHGANELNDAEFEDDYPTASDYAAA